MADNDVDDLQEEGHVYIFDRREGDLSGVKISLGGLFDFSLFRCKINEAFGIEETKSYAIVTTSRLKIKDDDSYLEMVESGDTLYILNDVEQILNASVQERIDYVPHYDTIVKSGMYEYYASAGQSPLPFALAELVDNALAATAANVGPRHIEVKLFFDDASSQHCICVSDNGCGMTSKDLNNWAVYRLSKFNRHPKKGKTSEPIQRRIDVARSLNSDIGYFGVGGKQAIFFIGNAVRMISKTKDSSDVHELFLSKEDFERKELQKESIYSGFIRNRRVGDSSHISSSEKSLKKIIDCENAENSYTNVVITGIDPKHISFFKQNFPFLCQQFSHIYHYYIHGPLGNRISAPGVRPASPFRNIDIEVVLYDKVSGQNRVSLRNIDNDLQTLFVRSAASSFEFNAHVEGTGVVEGILRYHPFLFEKETFPASLGTQLTAVNDHNYADFEEDSLRDSRAPRGDRPIFECFWNGRLIPYTTIESMDWCNPPKKKTLVPPECYYRFSGVLFTDDSFQVSTNKLTFMDLDVRLRERSTIFNKIVFGQEQRVNIGRAFNEWIKHCHETCDKQVKFFGYAGTFKRTDVPNKKSQHVWSIYKGIEWDGKIFKAGQLVRTSRTVPVIVGTIQKFLLFGEREGDEVFATGGEMEISQEPQSIYGEKKFLPLVKLDRSMSISGLKDLVHSEELKLPSNIVLNWPEGNELKQNAMIQAGSTVGPLKVDIQNGKHESVNKIPGDRMKKLLVEMKVIWHSSKEGDKTILQHTCQHGGKSWPYWFRKMENITNLGSHTLRLTTFVSDANSSPLLKSLPSLDIGFTITEAGPEKFTVGMLETPLKAGVPFQIPLTLQDKFGNIVKPGKDYGEPRLYASGIEFTSSGTCTRGNLLVIKDVVALGAIPLTGGKDFNLKISFQCFEDKSQLIRMRLLPGPPSMMEVKPDKIEIENGDEFKLFVEIKDKAGNLTSQPRLNVVCKMTGAPNLPSFTCDCSSTGKGVLTSPSISMKQLKGQHKLLAKIDLQHHKEVNSIQREIILSPSRRAVKFEVYYMPSRSEQKKKIQNNQDVLCTAGEIISGISYKLFDEGNRVIDLEGASLSKLKVNWAVKMNKDDVKKGNLPDIKAPVSIDDVKFCQVSYITAGNSVEFVFNLRSSHSQPTNMRCSCSDAKMKLNQSLGSDIKAMIYDDHGNFIKMESKDLADFTVTGEGLKENILLKGISSGFFVIRNVQFESGLPGPRELCLTWKGITGYQIVQLLAGLAVDLVLVDLDNSKPFQILNDKPFPKPIKIQLVDEAGNIAKDSNIRCMLARDAGLKLLPPPPQVRTDDQGQATFKSFSVSAPRGLYQIIPKAVLSKGTSEGPIILLSVEPDRNKPIEIIVKLDLEEDLIVGETLPAIQVAVLAEDEIPITIIKPKELILKLWRSSNGKSSDRMPANAISYTSSKGLLNDLVNHFFFRDLACPEQSGSYWILVQYITNDVQLSSKKIFLDVKPGPSVKLVPNTIPATPTVSNTTLTSSRQLVKDLRFELQDKFGNSSGLELNGVLDVYIKANGPCEMPMLQNGKTTASFNLVGGTATVESLMIQVDTKGVDGQEYLLVFQVKAEGLEPLDIEPFTLSFFFCDDARKKTKMTQLTKQRDEIKERIRAYRSLFSTTKQLVNEMKEAVQEASALERSSRMELRANNVKRVQSLTTPQEVANEISIIKKQKMAAEKEPRRQCTLPLGPRGKNILGKVAHLAQVHDNDVARVLSWHMSGDMDCVITLTTEQATQVYKETIGRQQVLPLDSIYTKGLPAWKKQLPHERFPGIRVTGNPVFARSLLTFPDHEEKCKTVFSMLLGDVIIINDIESANRYRQQVVKHMPCPTILTRTGDRIRNNGKFGGLQNKAPPIDRLQGVFASPLPANYQELCTQIDLLSSFEAVVSRHTLAKAELTFQTERCHSKKIKTDYKECLDAEKQLRSLEIELGMTPTTSEQPPSFEDFINTEENSKGGSHKRGGYKRTALFDEERSPSKKGRNNQDNSNSSRRGSTTAPSGETDSKRKRR